MNLVVSEHDSCILSPNMASNLKYISQYSKNSEKRSFADDLTALMALDAPSERFLIELLKVQCRTAGADGGVLVRFGKQERFEVLAAYPPPKTKGVGPKWFSTVAKNARWIQDHGQTVIKQEISPEQTGDFSNRQVIIIPIKKENTVSGAAAFVVRIKKPGDITLYQDRLEITPFLINFYEMRWMVKDRHAALHRMGGVLELLSTVNQSRRFMSAAMALCNESATRWHCSRVSLGFLKGRYVHVRAMSHTDKFNRKMKLLQGIEAAMEECLDQDIEVIHPAPADETAISRAAAELSKDHGPAVVLSLPLRQDNEVPAVLTLERPPNRPFTLDEIEAIRLSCDLCAPRIVELEEYDRWFGARMVTSVRSGLSRFLGPKHTGLKVWAVLIFSLAIFLTFGRGEYRAESSFVFESTIHQVVVSPIDSFIKNVSVSPGNKVEAEKTVLGELDTSELRLKLAALKAEQLGYQKKIDASIRDRQTVESQIAQAKYDKVAAEISLLELNIRQATLRAPITGRIISEDLNRQIGAPVEKGQVLFEIAGIDSLRAELYVPEDLIADVHEGQKGELAAVGHPEQRIRFVVEVINPMADVVNNHNVFKVRARLMDSREWMRPGMEGTARISLGRKRYAWLGSRRLINWLRMKLWF